MIASVLVYVASKPVSIRFSRCVHRSFLLEIFLQLLGYVVLHALRFCAGVVVAITFHEVDTSPNAKTCAKCDNQCLQYIDCCGKKCHVFVYLRKNICKQKPHWHTFRCGFWNTELFCFFRFKSGEPICWFDF